MQAHSKGIMPLLQQYHFLLKKNIYIWTIIWDFCLFGLGQVRIDPDNQGFTVIQKQYSVVMLGKSLFRLEHYLYLMEFFF